LSCSAAIATFRVRLARHRYPRINELVGELHKRRVSTFLVTNAQFPECIRQLAPVTQLYVSIDAATKESLKAVDRPLFADFWERFIASLQALREKHQRTVYRYVIGDCVLLQLMGECVSCW
jgi:tRNA wybutosine-synthesizing protein 1